MTGGGGDTVRSWRLRERLSAQEKFTPEDVHAIHFDSVNPARREIVALGLHLRDRLKRDLSEDALSALLMLEPWYRAGASSSLENDGAAVALELNTFFRFVSTKLAFVYGGGESGLAYFLKTARDRIKNDPQAELSVDEQQFIDQSLATAWQSCQEKFGDNPELWTDSARNAVSRQRMGYYESLDQFPALDDAQAVGIPPLSVTDGGTIGCQTAQSYTQWVPMHDPDLAQTILPLGQSERPESATRTSTLQLWSEGKLHPAPLSKEKVESLGVARTLLNYAN
jgi:acyl-homoserine lactone acylase PvdQ